ncbi:lipopolysaccharide N-acetylmannosaminouronosyltransferase [Rosenbergiella australiborealis]|uniref:lipopolysaccharide N-acetylmannosaminouronosyltransferase n=1 Tax=Rosenbergiella australiborealis TaxID=1544696 RepID=UPI001BDB1618
MSNRQLTPPYFTIREIPVYGAPSMEAFTDFLLPSQDVHTGRLIALNAEKVLTAEHNALLHQILTSGGINYPDGISIVRSIRKKYPNSKVTRIAGADLWQSLMQRAGALAIPVYLVGSQPSVLTQTAERLQQQWQVPLVGQQDGYFDETQTGQVIERIKASRAKIITVAMGSPRQELFIQRCYEAYPDALYMGVGGTYDVFIGKVKRAPLLWQRLGLEWLYRLIRQPLRLKRQLKLLKYQGYHWRGEL